MGFMGKMNQRERGRVSRTSQCDGWGQKVGQNHRLAGWLHKWAKTQRPGQWRSVGALEFPLISIFFFFKKRRPDRRWSEKHRNTRRRTLGSPAYLQWSGDVKLRAFSEAYGEDRLPAAAAESGLTKINQYVAHALNMNCSVWMCRPWEFRLLKGTHSYFNHTGGSINHCTV